MKIGMRSLRFFILLFAASSLLFHPPSDFEAFAATSDATIDSTVEINEDSPPSSPAFPTLNNNDYFGISVANIGDLDGDGVNDLAVGASHDGGSGARGAVHIMFMNINGTVKSDVVEINSSNFSLQKKGHFGTSVANIGDLNGDGVNDLAVGASGDECGQGSNNNRGAVHIIFMDTDRDGSVEDTVGINCTTTNGPVLASKEGFGASVANIGDLDGDGVNDLAVGASHYDVGDGTSRGALFIMFMNINGTVKSTVDHDTITNGLVLGDDDWFGRSVANIGDLDGDGVNDLAVGAIRDDMDENGDDDVDINRGAVHIMFMNIDGTVKSTKEINDFTTDGPVLGDNDHFGASVANIGDLDGDGVNDLAVGASGDDTIAANQDRGAVHIMFMKIDGTVKSTVEINQTTTNGPDSLAAFDVFGASVANIGDFDGNGVIDLAVGASGSAGGDNDKRGSVYIIFLHETTKPTVTITSTSGDSGDTVSSTTLSYTATFSESTSNFVVGDITVTGTANVSSPEASNFAGSGTTYTFDVVQGSSDGTVLVSVAAGVVTDAAENDNTASNTYTLTIDTSVATTSSTCIMHVILGNCGTIAINNDEYRIINTWTNVPTTEVLVGEPVTVTLSTPNNPTHTKIHFASVHTEVFSIPLDYQQSAHIDYSIMNNQVTYVSQSQLFQVAGATHRIVQDPDVKNLKMFEVVFTMVFAKPMDTSHIVVETENKFRIPETLYLIDALKVSNSIVETLTLEQESKFELIYEPRLKVDPEPSVYTISIDPEPEIDPEPDMDMLVVDPELVVSKATCGKGTMLKDNLCVPNEISFYFFVNQFMRLFG